MLLECHKAKQVLSQDGRLKLDEYMEKLKPGEQFFLKPVTKAEARSLQQSRYYWTVLLRAMQYYCDFLDFCPDPTQDKETAHFMCKMQYCMMERNDLLQKVKIRNPIDKKMVTRYLPFSWKLDQMPRKEANAYINWCKKMIENHSHVDFDLAIRSVP